MNILKLVKNTSFYIYFILFISFASKLFNLNYNSPSGDEAVYIAIGQSILFKWDWSIYNFASWLGGHAYFYPIVTSIGYFYNGIIGSRILNVIFSVVATYYVYLITEKVLRRSKGGLFKNRIVTSSLIASLMFSFSYTVIYVSRLATYDMPSFTMLLIGIYLLIDLCDKRYDDQGKAKRFFMSSIFLALSFGFKYISVLYFPLIVLTSFLYINRYFKKTLLRYYKYYFLMPLTLFVLILSFTQINYLLTYFNAQIVRESFNFIQVGTALVKNIFTVLPFTVFSLGYLTYKKRYKLSLLYLVWVLIIILFHIFANRISAIDKHVIYIVLPTSIFSAIVAYDLLRKKTAKYITLTVVIFYVIFNLFVSRDIKDVWPNFNTGINYLNDNLKKTDVILSENSASLILTSHKDISSENIITFDWFEYKNLVNEDAYRLAVFQGHFKYIELEESRFSKPLRYEIINKLVRDSLDKNYVKVLDNENYVIYKRTY